MARVGRDAEAPRLGRTATIEHDDRLAIPRAKHEAWEGLEMTTRDDAAEAKSNTNSGQNKLVQQISAGAGI